MMMIWMLLAKAGYEVFALTCPNALVREKQMRLIVIVLNLPAATAKYFFFSFTFEDD